MTEQEFAKIVNETKHIVLQAVRMHLAAQFYHAIDDVVQETYIRAYRHLAGGKFRQQSSLHTWLYRIAANESKRMTKRLLKEEKKKQKLALVVKETTTEIEVDDRLTLSSYINTLPDVYREVVTLKANGDDETTISNKLGIPKGTVKSRLSRAKLLIYKLMQGEL